MNEENSLSTALLAQSAGQKCVLHLAADTQIDSENAATLCSPTG